eukprot:scaffold3.g6230.t1
MLVLAQICWCIALPCPALPTAHHSFDGVYDIRRAVDAAEAGQVLLPLVLGAMASTLAAARGAETALLARQPQPSALLVLGAGVAGGLPDVEAAIRACIQPGEGRVLDSASPELAAIRAQRRQNQADLQREVESWARRLHAKGICERPQVVLRRDRQCVPVRLGRQGELPKGSVTLATSASGSTLYMEPAPCVALNNTETALAAAELAEEERVLAALSQLVAAHAPRVHEVVAAIAALDVAVARARHAAWLGAVRPRFLGGAEAAVEGAVSIPSALHPLLLQPSLPALPLPPLPPEQLQQLQQQELGPEEQQETESLTGLSLVPELAAAAVPAFLASIAISSSDSDDAGASSGEGGPAHAPPQPVHMVVPAGVSVVAVTGPNTGGKTASLKTLGLLVMMAKAGLFLPQRRERKLQEGQPAAGSAAASALAPSLRKGAAPDGGEPPTLLWFDRVLADLGDGQSLQQSLSTFSGHVRRIRGVLAAATPRSLVLLDEVGSGTDPAEGAALAAALLLHLRRRAALTYATTHHAELKELASATPGLVNASVEFDVATLRPTYRLLWGQAGESNALSVAEGLGFSAGMVREARVVAAALRQQQAAPDRGAALRQSLQEQVGDAQAAAARAARARAAAEAELAEARQQLQALREQSAAEGKGGQDGKSASAAARRQAQQAVADVRAGRATPQQAEERLRALEQGARAATLPASANEAAEAAAAMPEGWAPRAGEAVHVLKMGGVVGSVVAVRPGGKVTVRVGAMAVEQRPSDLAPAGKGASKAGGGGGRGGTTGGSQGRGAARQRGGGGGASMALAPTAGVAMQTAANTVDLRGMTADEAEAAASDAVAAAPSGWTLYVVHGVGTGRVRAAVQAALRRHPRVAKVEEEEASHGGCSVVSVR